MTPHVDIETLKKPSGLWQIAQSVLTAGILAVAGWMSASASKYTSVAEEQGKTLIRLEAQMTMMQAQLATLAPVPSGMVRIETKMDDAERRIHDLEELRKLK